MNYDQLIICTERDEGSEKDLIRVMEVRTYDDDGEEFEVDEATIAVQGIDTCMDQSEEEIETVMRPRIEAALAAKGITYERLEFEHE